MLVFYFTLPDDASDNELSRRVFSGDDMAFLCTLKIAFVNVLSDRVPGAVADTQGTCRSSRSVSRLRSSNSVIRPSRKPAAEPVVVTPIPITPYFSDTIMLARSSVPRPPLFIPSPSIVSASTWIQRAKFLLCLFVSKCSLLVSRSSIEHPLAGSLFRRMLLEGRAAYFAILRHLSDPYWYIERPLSLSVLVSSCPSYTGAIQSPLVPCVKDIFRAMVLVKSRAMYSANHTLQPRTHELLQCVRLAVDNIMDDSLRYLVASLLGVRGPAGAMREDWFEDDLQPVRCSSYQVSAFDREREKVNLRKSKIKKEGLEDVFSLPSAGELAPHTLVGESTVIRPQSSADAHLSHVSSAVHPLDTATPADSFLGLPVFGVNSSVAVPLRYRSSVSVQTDLVPSIYAVPAAAVTRSVAVQTDPMNPVDAARLCNIGIYTYSDPMDPADMKRFAVKDLCADKGDDDILLSSRLAKSSFLTAHKAHYNVMSCLLATQFRMAGPMPTASRDLDLLAQLLQNIETVMSVMLGDLDLCRSVAPSFFPDLDPTILDFEPMMSD
ncbi:hypothetical protein C8J57DRAFT_1493517 [Mycena rebaudengoi]|nr:hypothetical protein C8J57DRAFT_1493517 [Mycena rebaudengoi]